MVALYRKFVNILNSDPKEPHYKLSNQYIGHSTCETNELRGVELLEKPNTIQSRL